MTRSRRPLAWLLLASAAAAPAWGDTGSVRRCEPLPEPEEGERCSIYRKDGSLWQVDLQVRQQGVGPRTHYNPDGTVAWRAISNPDGSPLLIEEWHPNGKLAERREGLPGWGPEDFWLGRSQRWYENGQLHWEGSFVLAGASPSRSHPCGFGSSCTDETDAFEGLYPHGRIRRYRDDGSLWSEHQYENGLRQGPQRRYHVNGNVAEEWSSHESGLPGYDVGYVVDLPEGPYVAFYPDGSPRERGVYRAGKRIGEWRTLHPNGAVEEEQRYDDEGRPHGRWRRFDVGGRLLGESTFEHGQRIPPLPCPEDAEYCSPFPADADLPPLPLQPIGVAAKRCPSTAGPLAAQRSERRPDGGTHLCNLGTDGTLNREDELAADGTLLRSTEWFPGLETPMVVLEVEPGVRERTTRFDPGCLCKVSEIVKDVKTGVETVTRWQPTGLLEERGSYRPGKRIGLWTFWGKDGRVSHWIDFGDGTAERKIEN